MANKIIKRTGAGRMKYIPIISILLLLVLLSGCIEEIKQVETNQIEDNCRNINGIKLTVNNMEMDLRVPIDEFNYNSIVSNA